MSDEDMEELARMHCKGCLNAEKCVEEEWHDNLYDVVMCPFGKFENRVTDTSLPPNPKGSGIREEIL